MTDRGYPPVAKCDTVQIQKIGINQVLALHTSLLKVRSDYENVARSW